MRIRTKILLLIATWILALLVNLLALGYLARVIPEALAEAEQVSMRQQQAALRMRAELRDAEAALYRYLMEGERGFTVQFREHMQEFEQNLNLYASLAGNEQQRAWANQLQNDYQASLQIGEQLIQLRDRQTRDLAELEEIQAGASDLLAGPVRLARSSDVTYQAAVNDMQQNLQEMMLAVTAYLSSPDPEERLHFSEAAVRYYQAEQRFMTLSNTDQEVRWERSLAEAYARVQSVGLRLINERDQQMSQFARFAAILFQMGQETLEKQVQPSAELNLRTTWNHLQGTVRVVVVTSLAAGLIALLAAIAITIPLMRQMNAGMKALLAGADRVAAGRLDQPVGVMGGDERRRMARTFNAMMAELAARERRLKARLSELEALRQVSLQLTSTLDPDRVFQTIVDSALELAKAAEVHIFMWDDEIGGLRFCASAWQDREAHPPVRAPRPEGLVMHVARTGEAQVVNQADLHPLYSSEEARAWGIRAAAGLPLRVGERVVGVLNVIVRDRPTIGAEELRILRLLADQAAVAVESARLYSALADREARLQILAQKLAHVQEEERRLIGLDLHDGLTQLLISANMHFNTLASDAAQLDPVARQELELGRARLQAAIDEARRVIAELRPAALEDLGLVDGLRQYAANISQAANWQLEYVTNIKEGLDIPADIETALFRIAQEALANARKHAQTRQIRIALLHQDGHLTLEVQDWGQGFRLGLLADEKDRWGLVGMQERAALVNGTCHIHSIPGRGTSIHVRVPLPTHNTRTRT
ncbi:MAG: GAF domain-containing protein [Caldilineae bacterium]|nr:MAG: GAF domain-containing protein [Caldilineae bacterium]